MVRTHFSPMSPGQEDHAEVGITTSALVTLPVVAHGEEGRSQMSRQTLQLSAGLKSSSV